VSDVEYPDLYADGVQIASGNYGLALTFYLSDPDKATPEGPPGATIGRIRLGSELAEALADILKTAVADRKRLIESAGEEGGTDADDNG
jgi:hypothetical protein